MVIFESRAVGLIVVSCLIIRTRRQSQADVSFDL